MLQQIRPNYLWNSTTTTTTTSSSSFFYSLFCIDIILFCRCHRHGRRRFTVYWMRCVKELLNSRFQAIKSAPRIMITLHSHTHTNTTTRWYLECVSIRIPFVPHFVILRTIHRQIVHFAVRPMPIYLFIYWVMKIATRQRVSMNEFTTHTHTFHIAYLLYKFALEQMFCIWKNMAAYCDCDCVHLSVSQCLCDIKHEL